MRRIDKIAQFLFMILVAAIVIYLPTLLSPNPFVFIEFGVNKVAQLLTVPLLISLLMERSLEVFITTWRGPRAEELDIEVQRHELRISELRNNIEYRQKQSEITSATVSENVVIRTESSGASTTLTRESLQEQKELIEQLNAEIDALKKDDANRSKYKSNTRRIALWSALSLGVLISAVGVRAIEPLIVLNQPDLSSSQVTSSQLIIFRWLDVFLTGGLIAGGSEGIHKITQPITDFLEATSKTIKDKP
ncbi:MAG TPA: hypothetical protein V6D14_02625 [Coleofasciculaceae cyanobacterium]|jgi:hypothetical protein